jgi:hypothetical protein
VKPESIRERLPPAAFRVGILSLISSLAFSQVHRWDEQTPCPTYFGSIFLGIVMAVGFVMNAAAFRWRNFLLAVTLAVVLSFTLPPMQMSRQARNESKALATLQEIWKAEEAFRVSSNRQGTIAELVSRRLLPRCVADVSWGYRFDARVREDGLTITASPATSISGRWTFHKSPDGIIRYSQEKDSAPAGHANEPVR